MSKWIEATQYAQDGSIVHVHVLDDGNMEQAYGDDGQPLVIAGGTPEEPTATPVLKPHQTTHTFGAMPEYTDASQKTKFVVDVYVAQCEREVQALLDAEVSVPLVEVKH